MKKERLVQKTEKVIDITCDDCGEKGYRQCYYCYKDLCEKCTRFLDHNPLTNEYHEDYPEKVCKDCEKELIKAGREVSELREECEWLVEKLDREIREKQKKKREVGHGDL
jgi:hypothetical protein